jgi:hypothetical protein
MDEFLAENCQSTYVEKITQLLLNKDRFSNWNLLKDAVSSKAVEWSQRSTLSQLPSPPPFTPSSNFCTHSGLRSMNIEDACAH